MRCAHFSDLHYNEAHLEESDRCFGHAIDAAIAGGVDVAVVSGDASEHALKSHEPALFALASQLRRLADHCPVLLLQGTFTHDPPGALRLFQLLGGRFPIHVAERLQQVALDADGRWHASEGWQHTRLPGGTRALFTCVPTLNRAMLAAHCGSAAELGSAGYIADLLSGYAPGNMAARAAGIPTLAVSHGTVAGSYTEHGAVMAGLDHEFTTGALFSAGADAFLLGHIHLHQRWQREGQLIAYAGSIGRFHFGEPEDKGFLLWQVAPGLASAEMRSTPARRTVDLVFDGPPALAQLREAAADGKLHGAHVRVRWHVAEEESRQVDRRAIAVLLDGAASIKLEGRVIPILAARAPGIARLAGLAPQIAAWAESVEAAPAPLLACLEDLRASSPESVAERLLAACTSGADAAEALQDACATPS
ncbi:metallophosphatase family protein [Rugamonas sp. FT29W]|uniref:Metallophosphatase family protein n=1 Tax=Rugamonas aquatica TaxID=2743357 RepID=A0A6A7N6D4_9BURK|nr:metallophosphatase family protein [Rugamonas aquatica]